MRVLRHILLVVAIALLAAFAMIYMTPRADASLPGVGRYWTIHLDPMCNRGTLGRLRVQIRNHSDPVVWPRYELDVQWNVGERDGGEARTVIKPRSYGSFTVNPGEVRTKYIELPVESFVWTVNAEWAIRARSNVTKTVTVEVVEGPLCP